MTMRPLYFDFIQGSQEPKHSRLTATLSEVSGRMTRETDCINQISPSGEPKIFHSVPAATSQLLDKNGEGVKN